jgi:hypothetical protein
MGHHAEPAPIEISREQPRGRGEHTARPRRGVPSPNERWFATARDLGDVLIWDRQKRRLHGALHEGPLKPKASPPMSLDFSWDSRVLAAGYRDGAVRIWDVAERRLLKRIDLGDECRQVRFARDATYLAAGRYGCGFTIWNWRSGQALFRAENVPWGTQALAWSPDDRLLVVGQDDQVISFWNTADWRVKQEITGLADRIECLTIAPDGRTLVVGSADGTIRLWHVPTARPIGVLYQTEWPREFITDVAIDPGGRFLAAATQETGQQGILVTRGFGSAE